MASKQEKSQPLSEGVIADGRTAKWLLLGSAAAVVTGLALYERKYLSAAGATAGAYVARLAAGAVSQGQALAFAAALPATLRPYASNLISTGARYGISPWLLAGMLFIESNGGAALTPPGPGGTGDFGKRPAGRSYRQADGSTYVVGSSGLPEDGQGWGRGLMQIDWGVHHSWFVGGARWQDPQVNIDKAGELAQSNMRVFTSSPGGPITVDSWRVYDGLQSPRVAAWQAKYGLASTGPFRDPRPLSGALLNEALLAAHNAGASGVLQAVAAGLPPEAPTANNNYVTYLSSRITSWMGNF